MFFQAESTGAKRTSLHVPKRQDWLTLYRTFFNQADSLLSLSAAPFTILCQPVSLRVIGDPSGFYFYKYTAISQDIRYSLLNNDYHCLWELQTLEAAPKRQRFTILCQPMSLR